MGSGYFADIKWLKKHGLKPNDARRLANALCTLADFEGTISDALAETRSQRPAVNDVCRALRYLVDGEDQ